MSFIQQQDNTLLAFPLGDFGKLKEVVNTYSQSIADVLLAHNNPRQLEQQCATPLVYPPICRPLSHSHHSPLLSKPFPSNHTATVIEGRLPFGITSIPLHNITARHRHLTTANDCVVPALRFINPTRLARGVVYSSICVGAPTPGNRGKVQ